MKKLLITATATVIALSACTTERVIEVEKTTPTTQYVAPVTTPADKELTFINNLTADFPGEVSTLGKVKVLELGYLMCDAIDDGTTLNDLVAMASRTGVDAAFIGALVRESVHNFCPENQWFIDAALNA